MRRPSIGYVDIELKVIQIKELWNAEDFFEFFLTLPILTHEHRKEAS